LRFLTREPERLRLAVSIVVGVAAAVLALSSIIWRPNFISDFDQAVVGIRVLLQGGNPYEHIGPGRAWDYLWPLYYPAPALVLAAPFAVFPILIGRALFIAFGMGVFTWALLKRAPHCWPMLLSYPAMSAVDLIQWAPWMAAALTLPWLGIFAAAKPNTGIAVVVGQRRIRDTLLVAGLGAAVTVISLVIRPSWPLDWWRIIRDGTHPPMIARPFGFVLLLAAIRWRRPEARTLLALSVLPTTAGPPEGLLFATVARTRKEALMLALVSHAMLPVAISASHFRTFLELSNRNAIGVLAFIYIPALVVLLLTRSTPGEPRLEPNGERSSSETQIPAR